jgi:hypothetical protein
MVRPSPRERRLHRTAAADRYPGDPNDERMSHWLGSRGCRESALLEKK